MESKSGKKKSAIAKNLKAVHHEKLHEKIVSQIQELIQKGKLNHGDRLPPERELAEIFKVSRHSVREAIRSLEQKRVLKSRPGSGTYVIIEDANLFADALAGAIQRDQVKMEDIFQFRRLIEPQIAGLAAQNATDDQIRELESLYEEQKESLDEPFVYMEKDQQFHNLMALATGNSILIQIVELMTDILKRSRNIYSLSKARIKGSISGHGEILSAIKAHDCLKTKEAMTKHLIHIESIVMKNKEKDR